MTISMSVSVPGGFVLGSESRQIIADENWLRKFSNHDYGDNNFIISKGEFPKVYNIGKFGLCYSGPSFAGSWTFSTEVKELQKMASSAKYSFEQLAAHLNNNLVKALGKLDYGFYFAGYEDGLPVFTDCNNGRLNFESGKVRNLTYSMRIVGMVAILEKLFADEVVSFSRMTLEQAVEFTYLTIVSGSKYLEYFDKYPEVSGGEIYILIIKPEGCEFLRFPAFGISALKGASV